MAGEMIDSGSAGVTLELAFSLSKAFLSNPLWLEISLRGSVNIEAVESGGSSARPSKEAFGCRGCGAIYGDFSVMVVGGGSRNNQLTVQSHTAGLGKEICCDAERAGLKHIRVNINRLMARVGGGCEE